MKSKWEKQPISLFNRESEKWEKEPTSLFNRVNEI